MEWSSTDIHADFPEGDTGIFCSPELWTSRAEPEEATIRRRTHDGTHPGETGGDARLIGNGEKKIGSWSPASEGGGNLEDELDGVTREIVTHQRFKMRRSDG